MNHQFALGWQQQLFELLARLDRPVTLLLGIHAPSYLAGSIQSGPGKLSVSDGEPGVMGDRCDHVICLSNPDGQVIGRFLLPWFSLTRWRVLRSDSEYSVYLLAPGQGNFWYEVVTISFAAPMPAELDAFFRSRAGQMD